MSAKRFGVASVGTTVLLSIPDIDRGRCEFPHLKAIVLEVSTGGMYKLGCLTGILDSHYSRNQFSPTLEKFLTMEQVPKDKTISLRTAAREESMGSGQGFFRKNVIFCFHFLNLLLQVYLHRAVCQQEVQVLQG